MSVFKKSYSEWRPGMAGILNEWRTGREDMQSYDGETGQLFATIYRDDPDGAWHLGERLPIVVSRIYGANCKAVARAIVEQHNEAIREAIRRREDGNA